MPATCSKVAGMESNSLRRGVLLIMALFCLQPMVIGAWLALIPYVKADLDLTKLELAVALLGAPSALIVALQFAGKAVSRFGLRRLMMGVFPIQCASGFLPLIAVDQVTLFLGLAVFGATLAFMEVGMNVYAGRVEKVAAKHIMNRCHGFWALGLMIGSFVTAQGAGALGPIGIMAVVGIASGGIGVIAARALPRVGADGGETTNKRRKLNMLPGALLPVGLFMLLTTLTEGAMADWSALYLSERQSVDLTSAGIAVTIFSGFMAAGRFSGDWIKTRVGALVLARGSVVFSVVGLICLVAPLPIAFAFIGFACVGVGVAAGYPLGVSAVAALDDEHEAANVAIMSTFALTGFLIGPPVIGFLADAYGLRFGFAAMIPGLILCLYLAKWLNPAIQPKDSV